MAEAAIALGEFLVSDTVVAAAGSVAAGAAGAYVAGQMAPSPGMPEVKPPTPMPDQRATETARRRSLAEQISRRGRTSTILTDPGDTLG